MAMPLPIYFSKDRETYNLFYNILKKNSRRGIQQYPSYLGLCSQTTINLVN